MHIRRLAVLGTALSLLAGAALAAPPVVTTGSLGLKDASGASQSEIVIPVPGYSGAAPVPFYLGHLNFGENALSGGFQPEILDGSDYGLWTHTTNGALEAGGNLGKLQAAAGAPTDPSSTATDNTAASEIALLKGEIVELRAVLAALAPQGGGGLAVAQADQTGSNASSPLNLQTLNAAFTIPLSAGRGTVKVNEQGLAGTSAVLIPETEAYQGAPWVVSNVRYSGGVTQAISSATGDGDYNFVGSGAYAVRLRVGVVATAAATSTIGYTAGSGNGIVAEMNSATIAANGLGTSNFAPGQATMNTTSGLVVAARAGRRTVVVENTGTTPVFLGGAGVTPTTGFRLPGMDGASVAISYAGALYGVTSSGTAALSEYELY